MGNAKRENTFLYDMHYFRAFAIINVVMIHVWRIPEDILEGPCLINLLGEVLFHDSTIYFIFISGFLFHYLSSRFVLSRYIKSKIYNVISPYIILSTAIYFLKIFFYKSPHMRDLGYYLHGLTFGTFQVQLWYIPFITLIFLISPALLKIPPKAFRVLALGVMLAPLLGTRTGTEITVGQYVYFFPIYCFGMACSMYYDTFLRVCRKYFRTFCLVALGSTLVMLFVFLRPGADVAEAIKSSEPLFFLQKMSILMLTVHLLQRIKDKRIPLLDLIADYSFAIYFLHVLFYGALWRMLHKMVPHAGELFWSIVFTIVPVLIVLTILPLVSILKKGLKSYSRMVVGA